MSKQTFPTFVDQPGCIFRNFRVTGSGVQATAGTGGLDGRGQFLCTIKQAANVFTIYWNVTFPGSPYVMMQPSAGQSNIQIDVTTNDGVTFVYEAFESDDHTTPVANPNVDFLVCGYNTESFVS